MPEVSGEACCESALGRCQRFLGNTRNFPVSWPIATYVQTTAIRSGALPRRNHHADLSGEVAAQTVPRAHRRGRCQRFLGSFWGSKRSRGRCQRFLGKHTLGRCKRFLGRHTQLSRLLADSNVCPDHCDSFRSTPSSKSPRGPFRGGCCSDRPPSSPTSSSASSARHRPSTA